MIRLAVRCGPDAAERVLAELLVLAPGGVEEERGDGWVEYAIYGAPGELPDLGSVEALTGAEPIRVSTEEIPDDWADRWRDFHEAILIAGTVLVRPSWLEAEPDAALEVVVDPGQAFGTGAHPTTRMCVELLVALAEQGEASGSLADLGTGSGVLAIGAAKLGFEPVLAVDHEAAALDAARANAQTNGVDLRLQRVNLREEAPPLGETVVANLTAPLLLELAERLRARPDRIPPRLVCSGLLEREADEVSAAFEAAGLAECERRRSGDWVALRMAARPGSGGEGP